MKQRRILSLILTIAMIAGMFTFAAMPVSATTGDITIGNPSGTLTAGTAGSITFNVSVEGWTNEEETATIVEGVANVPTVVMTTTVTDGTGTGVATVTTTADTPAGTYTLKITTTGAAGDSTGVTKTFRVSAAFDPEAYTNVNTKDWTYNGLKALGMEIDLRAAIIEATDSIAAGGTPTSGFAFDIYEMVEETTSGSLTHASGLLFDLSELILGGTPLTGQLTYDIINMEIELTKLNIQIDILDRLIKGVDEILPDTPVAADLSASKVYAKQADVTAAETALASAKNSAKLIEAAIKLATDARDKAIDVRSAANSAIQPAKDAIDAAIDAAEAAYDEGATKSTGAIKVIMDGLAGDNLTVADYADPAELEAAEDALTALMTAVDDVVAAYKDISAVKATVENMIAVATPAAAKAATDYADAQTAVSDIGTAVTTFTSARTVGELAASRFDIQVGSTVIPPNMEFGNATTGAVVITPVIDTDVMSIDAGGYDYANTYQILVSSSDEKVVTIEPGDNTDEYNVIAQGKGSAVITLEVVPLGDDRFPVGSPILKGDKKTYKVTVARAPTDNTVTAADFKVVSEATGIATVNAGSVAAGVDSEVTIDFINEVAYMSTTPASGVDTIAAYSVDGSKWVSLAIKYWDDTGTGNPALEGVDISKILDKGANNLQFASRLEGNSPAPGATIWEVGKINPRPSSSKIGIKYETQARSGKYYWTFDVRDLSKLLFASSKDGSTPDADQTTPSATEFGFATPAEGDAKLEVQATPQGEKPGKYNYVVKTKPIMTATTGATPIMVTPASKISKVKVSGELKAPTAKADYKGEKVTVKAGLEYYVGARDVTTHTSAAWTEMKKPLVKEGVTFATIFGATPTVGAKQSVYVRTLPTEKKPPSAVAEIKVNGPKAWAGDLGVAENGKYKLTKGLEARKVGTTKWATSIKATATGDYEVREKATAKFDAKDAVNNMKGLPASEIKTVTVTWGDVDTGKTDKDDNPITKPGVVSVVLKP